MDIQAITNYVKQCGKIEMPDIQEHFNLNYSDTVKAFAEMEKKGIVKFCEGFTYALTAQEEAAKKTCQASSPPNSQQATYIKALWECVKEGEVSIPFLLRKCSIGFYMASKAIAWMEENGYVSAEYGLHSRDVLITREEFEEKFGNQDESDTAEQDDTESFAERRRREAMERLRRIIVDNNDEDDDDDDYEDDDDEDEEVKYEEWSDSFEKKHQEIIERLRLAKEENERKLKEEHDKTVAEIQSECTKMPDYNAEDDTFSVKMRVTYPDGMPFRIKVVEQDDEWYLSDCGRTIDYLSGFNGREALTVYLNDVLKTDHIRIIDNAVCTTLDDIEDLSGESAYLFKVVNALVDQQNFEPYYLGEELLGLAYDVLANEDSEMMVNALSAIDEKPMFISGVQRTLHIGRTRAVRITQSLLDLGLVEMNGAVFVRSEKCSKEFVSYLKRMLDKKTDE